MVGDTVQTAAPATVAASRSWARRYSRRLLVTDAAVVSWAVAGAHVTRFGWEDHAVATTTFVGSYDPTYVGVSVALALTWLLMLSLRETRSATVVGTGPEEYRRVIAASLQLFGLVAVAAFLLKADLGRGYLLIAFPAGTAGLLLGRYLWRQWLHLQRRAGTWSDRVVVAGQADQVAHLTEQLARDPGAGYQIVAACTHSGQGTVVAAGRRVPVRGRLEDVLDVAQACSADIIAVTSTDAFSGQVLRQLGWQLEGTDTGLMVAPALTDVAGPRIHLRPVGGLPLLHVEKPRLPRGGRLAKESFDRVGAAVLLVILSPVLVVIAILIRAADGGPALYRQERVGRGNALFEVLKFRSMRVDADADLPALLAAQGTADRPLFKVDEDPRVTTVGRFLRCTSLDELPQLVNVLRGEMSLVGPRPQRPTEVALYTGGEERRLLAKPGMTGLWQVSGRSDLPWEEAVRLDLYYVENWSFTFDLLLLWRTVGVVLRGTGR